MDCWSRVMISPAAILGHGALCWGMAPPSPNEARRAHRLPPTPSLAGRAIYAQHRRQHQHPCQIRRWHRLGCEFANAQRYCLANASICLCRFCRTREWGQQRISNRPGVWRHAHRFAFLAHRHVGIGLGVHKHLALCVVQPFMIGGSGEVPEIENQRRCGFRRCYETLPRRLKNAMVTIRLNTYLVTVHTWGHGIAFGARASRFHWQSRAGRPRSQEQSERLPYLVHLQFRIRSAIIVIVDAGVAQLVERYLAKV